MVTLEQLQQRTDALSLQAILPLGRLENGRLRPVDPLFVDLVNLAMASSDPGAVAAVLADNQAARAICVSCPEQSAFLKAGSSTLETVVSCDACHACPEGRVSLLRGQCPKGLWNNRRRWKEAR